jgi:predicted  nucleic acid-binding Zn-ribbon protein
MIDSCVGKYAKMFARFVRSNHHGQQIQRRAARRDPRRSAREHCLLSRGAPYEAELTSLRAELATAQERLLRERSKISTLEYRIGELDKQQSHTKIEISRTAVKVDNVGDATRMAVAQIEEIAAILDSRAGRGA